MPEAQRNPVYYRRNNAADLVREKWGIPCATRTLAKLASVGGGPEMVYSGRIPLYTEKALDAWAASRISAPVTSTSDRDSKGAQAPAGGAHRLKIASSQNPICDKREEA
jgi:hypothetical protein